MRPLIITVNNFLPFFGETTVDLREVKGAVVSGKNEVGKSSYFIDSILFALFGRARKKQEGLIHDLADDMWVRFLFGHQGQYYTVKRSVTRNKLQKLSLWQNTEIDKVTDLEKGKDLTERLLTNTQSKLEEIIGVSYDLLLATSISQQGEINKFLNMQPAQREQVLIEMLSLDLWEKKKKRTSELIKQSQEAEEAFEQLDLELQLTEGQIEELTGQTTAAEKELEPLLTTRDELQKQEENEKHILEQAEERSNLLSKYSVLQGAVKQLQLQLDSFKDIPKREVVQEAIGFAKAELSEIDDLALEIRNQQTVITTRNKELAEKERYVRGLISRQPQTALLLKVPCIGTQYHDQCGLLEQGRLTKQEIDKYLAGLSRRFATLEEVLKHFVGLQDTDKEREEYFNKSTQELVTKKNDHTHSLSQAEHNLKQLENKKVITISLAEKEGEASELQVKLQTIPEVDTKRLIDIQVQLKGVENNIKEIEIKHAQRSVELELRQTHCTQLKQKLEQVRGERDKVSCYRTLHQAYSDIPTLLFTETIPHVEAYTNEILSKISPDKQVILRAYRDTKAKTQVKALDILGTTSTGARDFENLSGSEKFRQSLALRAALARVNSELYSTEIGFFIVDEGFGSLDDTNVQLIKQTLRDIAKQFDLFLVITHVADLKDTFDTEIIVTSGSKGSRINIGQCTPSEGVVLDG